MNILKNKLRAFSFLRVALVFVPLAACQPIPGTVAQYPSTEDRDEKSNPNDIYSKPQTVFDSGDSHSGGLHLFGHGNDKENNTSGIGVNTFLWRASLDTVAFMPLASADPFGGTILTDWYAPPESPGERYKLNVLILDRQLRADGIQVKVFRQVRAGHNGGWQDAAVPSDMGRKIEDAILTRARQLRVSQSGGN